jgi:hypothetical protein
MPTIIFFFMVLGLMLLVVGLALAIGNAQRPRVDSSETKALRRLVSDIQSLAYEYKDTDPGLSYKITDKISEHNRKELG